MLALTSCMQTDVDNEPGSSGLNSTVLMSDDLVPLDQLWIYHKGDNPTWSNLDLDDSRWSEIESKLNLNEIPDTVFEGICWFRTKFKIDSTLVNKPLGLVVAQSGASEIYIDGKLVANYGTVGLNKETELAYHPGPMPLAIFLDSREEHQIAIRYSNHRYLEAMSRYEVLRAGPTVSIKDLNESTKGTIATEVMVSFMFTLIFGLLFAFSFIHLLIYLFYKRHKSNLYYSLFTFVFSLFFLFPTIGMIGHDPSVNMFVGHYIYFLIPLLLFSLTRFMYSLFYDRLPKVFWALTILTVVTILVSYFFEVNNWLIIVQAAFGLFEAVRIIIRGLIKKQQGSKILGTGVLLFVALISAVVILIIITTDGQFEFNISGVFGLLLLGLILLALLSIPLSMSVYLARVFATVNKNLEEEKEKLEARVVERTAEVILQKETIEDKNQEIIDSITYAKRIQRAILPSANLIKSCLSESFILYKPKDIVAGDFYWIEPLEDETILFAAADCTGHGVPGAMVSVVCNNAMNRAVREYSKTEPGAILDKTRDIVIQEFEKSDEEVKDGMDIALCSLNGHKLQYAGAHNPLWIIREGEIIETKANKQPIGKFDNLEPYTTHSFYLQKGDSIYIFSDGYVDQFGGEKGKKFKAKAFRALLLSIQDKQMEEKKIIIDDAFEGWRGNLEQIDDVCVIGVKIE